MNYAPNETRWKIGDLVIHDADDKCAAMLMRVTGYATDGRCKTIYARATKMNGDSGSRHPARWENPLTHLHDPARFGLGQQAEQAGKIAKLAAVRTDVVLAKNGQSDAGDALLRNPTPQALCVYQTAISKFKLTQEAYFSFCKRAKVNDAEAVEAGVAFIEGVEYLLAPRTYYIGDPCIGCGLATTNNADGHLCPKDKGGVYLRCRGSRFPDGVGRVWETATAPRIGL